MFGRIFLSKSITEENGVLRVINPVVEHSVPFLPTTSHFYLYANIVTYIIKPNYDIKLFIKFPDSREVNLVQGNVENNSLNANKGIIELNLNIETIILTEEGIHSFKLYLDDQLIDEYAFVVFNEKINVKGGIENE